MLHLQHITLAGLIDFNGEVALKWSVSGESQIRHYDLEKSLNGVDFTTIRRETGVLNTGNLVTYFFNDNLLSNTGGYYRVKALGINAGIQFSKQIFLQKQKSVAQVNIYPNPIIDHIIRIQLSGSHEGIWQIALYNNAGQLVVQMNWKVATSDEAIVLAVNPSLPAGIYHLRMISRNIRLNQAVLMR